MKKVRIWLSRIALALLALFVLLIIVSLFVYPAEYVGRVLRWGNSDVFDYQKFPARDMPAAAQPFQFIEAYDPGGVQAVFAEMGIDDLDAYMTETKTQAFLVLHGDQLLYEGYYNGTTRDGIVTSFSMAKSFTSALIGIAIEEGSIQSVDDPITDYLPELLERDPRFAEITIYDLLRMSSGIRYVEFPFFSGDDALTYYYPDLRTLALDKTEITGIPGESWLYNNYHPLLLGLILERATGMPVADYLASRIWAPFGAQYGGSWSLDSENGFEKMESGINARALDFAKFGLLFLNDGAWQGQQLVPAEWVRRSTTPIIESPGYFPNSDFFTEGGFYQMMWWGKRRGVSGYDFAAEGNFGQFIYISPEKGLIIVRHGINWGIASNDWIDLFYDFSSEYQPPN